MTNKKDEIQYYTLDNILKHKCTYNMIIGERSNGKTFATLEYGVKQYFKNGSQMGIVRRWKEDIIGRRASAIFSAINSNHLVEKYSGGEFEGITYYAGRFYVCVYDSRNKPVYNESNCIGFCFSLSDVEHNKSNSFPNIRTIIFDEFLTKQMYIQDEFVCFMNTISTIVRQRDDVKIFMLGNTVNKFCPYFTEMGLKHITNMNQGDIDVYTYGDKGKLKVAVEYCASLAKQKKNNYYFAFDNPKLQMITSGAWELDMYPHVPIKFIPKDIKFTYFIIFNNEIFQCEIIDKDDNFFTYIHRKTTPLQNTDKDLIYCLEHNSKINYNRNILKPMNKLQQRILWFFQQSRVFFQDNEVGDCITNYVKSCKQIHMNNLT